MDAVKFLKERIRMCNFYNGCDGCPLQKECLDTDAEAMVNAVEQWLQAHSQKTMMQDFFEKFPNAPTKNDGCSPIPCPDQCGYENIRYCIEGNKNILGCKECWSRLLED